MDYYPDAIVNNAEKERKREMQLPSNANKPVTQKKYFVYYAHFLNILDKQPKETHIPFHDRPQRQLLESINSHL